MPTSTAVAPTVAIIGAGLTGLLVAHGLQQNGIRAVVYEQEESIDARQREWTMLIHWGMSVFEKLVPKYILKDLNDALCNPHLKFDEETERLPCYNGVTGDILFSSPLPGSRRVSRRRLRKLLARDVDIRWQKSLQSLMKTKNGIRLEFEDGETVEVDYVLGADGTSSKVREILLGAEVARPRGSGFNFATGITKFDDAEKTKAIVQVHPVAALMMGTSSVAGLGVLSVDDPNDMSTWTSFWVKIWQGDTISLTGPAALDYIREHTAPLRDTFQSVIDWTPDDSDVSVNEMKYWIPTPWNNYKGRVTLAGDAAHPMLIYRGQGFQHSITDVDKYIDAMVQLQASADPDDGLRDQIFGAYDDEVVERGAQAVQESLSEATKSFNIETVQQMLMAKKGHGRSK